VDQVLKKTQDTRGKANTNNQSLQLK
jgi:hypothetical protein